MLCVVHVNISFILVCVLVCLVSLVVKYRETATIGVVGTMLDSEESDVSCAEVRKSGPVAQPTMLCKGIL